MSDSALSPAMQTDVLARDTIVRPARTYRVPSRKRLLAVGAALALAAGAGWYGADWWRNGRFIESTDDR